jgi:hypothetical protein
MRSSEEFWWSCYQYRESYFHWTRYLCHCRGPWYRSTWRPRVVKTDGWQGDSFLDASSVLRHEWLVPGSGKEAPKVLPWVHTLIANIEGNIRGIHHGVSPKHLPCLLAEFCYRFNRCFWEPQMFNRILHACLNSATITFSELRT